MFYWQLLPCRNMIHHNCENPNYIKHPRGSRRASPNQYGQSSTRHLDISNEADYVNANEHLWTKMYFILLWATASSSFNFLPPPPPTQVLSTTKPVVPKRTILVVCFPTENDLKLFVLVGKERTWTSGVANEKYFYHNLNSNHRFPRPTNHWQRIYFMYE